MHSAGLGILFSGLEEAGSGIASQIVSPGYHWLQETQGELVLVFLTSDKSGWAWEWLFGWLNYSLAQCILLNAPAVSLALVEFDYVYILKVVTEI